MATLAEALALAVQHHQAGRLDLAEEIYRRVLAADPEHADALHLLGAMAHQRGQHEVAVAAISRAIALRPSDAQFHNNLGEAYRALGRAAEAMLCYRRAVELNADFAEAYNNLGNALRGLGQLDEALGCYRQAIERRPDYVNAHNNLGNVLKEAGRLEEALACYRRALELNPDSAVTHSNLIYALHFHDGADAQSIAAEHRRWVARHAAPLTARVASHPNDRSPDRRLRIGYVSPDFCGHVIGFNLLPLFARHDHERFEIFCYDGVHRPDATTERFRAAADTWRRIVGLGDAQVAELVRADRIDILVDLTQHMAYNRLLVFARKPAPVQISFAGYPGSTGLPTIDYRLTDPYLDPPNGDDRDSAERAFRLPDTFWCYDAMAQEPAVNSLPALAAGHVTFGCLNNFGKTNPAAWTLWGQILSRVEGSRLVVLAAEGSHRQRARALLAEQDVEPERLTFVANQPREP
jgi:predicted O-linked N-acetylglucosamine transferase (SPINDLY family)